MSALDILINYKDAFAQGLLTTFQLAAIVWVCGLLLGSALGVLGARFQLPIGIPSRFISFTLSGVPILVFLFWLHYPMQSLLGIVVDPFITAAVTLTIVNIFAVSDVVRNVLADFPAQYVTAAQVCGMTQGQITVHVQLPIVFRQVVPLLLMIQVNMLQATLFASLISVNDIFRVAQQINSQIYRPVEIYTALGILFLAVCLPMNGLALYLKGKYTRDFSEH
jgi:polar amino acid transport system permease protein